MSVRAEAFSYEGHDLEALADLPRYYRWIRSFFGPELSGSVLEVGAGIGNFAAHYVDEVDRTVLVELSLYLAQRLRTRFSERAGVETLSGLLAPLMKTGEIRPASFDCAVLVNVLEHVPDDEDMLRDLHSGLRPGGRLLLFVSALPWLYGSLDEVVFHVRRYTRPELLQKLERAGFELVRMRYFDILGVLAWFLVGRVLRRRRFDAAAARAYDRIGVPVTAWLERRIEPPWGKNLVCVARRPNV